MNLHKAKGKKIGRQVRQLLKESFQKIGPNYVDGDEELLDMIEQNTSIEVERSECAKARERRKKAEKHAMTKDMFDVSL